MHTLYRYSLAFFFEIFSQSMNGSSELNAVKDDYDQRLSIIKRTLFYNAFRKIAPGLLEIDALVYALRLAQIMADQQEPLGAGELDLLLKGASVDITKSSSAPLAEQCKAVLTSKLNQQQIKGLQDLHSIPCFQGLVGSIKSNESAWVTFLDHIEAENAIPDGWQQPGNAAGESNRILQEALILKALRPDRLIFTFQRLVDSILGKGFLNLPEFDLAVIMQTDSKASSPIMMVSVPGFDPSGKVTHLAHAQGKSLQSAAMGSEEGFKIADKAIASASKAGTWVLLKNVHLAIKWLHELEKKPYGMNPQQNFRLFLTLEFNPKIPANLIRLSRVYVFEPPSGVKASLQRSFTQTLVSEKTDRPPVERCRLHFLLAFLHAVVLERLRFFPVGWSKKYEFSDADQACGRDVIDAWVDSVTNSGQLSNISPDKIPWDAIQSVLSEAIYGGRIDNEFDHVILRSFIRHLFCEDSYNRTFSLNVAASQEHRLESPDGRKREQFIDWIESLPAKGSPGWVGLPLHAERMLRISRANHTLSRWLMLQGSVKTVSKADKSGSSGAKKGAAVVSPVAELGGKVRLMIGNLPESLPMLPRSEGSMGDPLWRCYNREIGVGASLLARVRGDLERLSGFCNGTVKATNDVRQLIQDLKTDSVPKSWKKYVVADMTVTEWLADLSKRIEQLRALMASSSFQEFRLWFGGLFFPEAFLTASRQAVAQKLKLSLEELVLVVRIGGTGGDTESFVITGLYMEGATWDQASGQLQMTDELMVAMPQSVIRWVHRNSAEFKETLDFLKVPVYLNNVRRNLISSFNLRPPKEVNKDTWLQRSICLTLWTK